MVVDISPRRRQPSQTSLLCIALLLAHKLSGACAGLEKHCPENFFNNDPQGVCGDSLSDMIQWTCTHFTYSNSNSGKRSLSMPDEEKGMLEILLDKKDAYSFLAKRQSSQTQGVVCECCTHQCTIYEMQEYCPAPVCSLSCPANTDLDRQTCSCVNRPCPARTCPRYATQNAVSCLCECSGGRVLRNNQCVSSVSCLQCGGRLSRTEECESGTAPSSPCPNSSQCYSQLINGKFIRDCVPHGPRVYNNECYEAVCYCSENGCNTHLRQTAPDGLLEHLTNQGV